MHFLTAAQVEALADAIEPPYGVLIRLAAYTGLRPCEYVALKVGRRCGLFFRVLVSRPMTLGEMTELGQPAYGRPRRSRMIKRMIEAHPTENRVAGRSGLRRQHQSRVWKRYHP
jgi:integrase